MGDVIDERDVDMWGEDTSTHDTACDCKGCLLDEWAAESKRYEAEVERLRKVLQRIGRVHGPWRPVVADALGCTVESLDAKRKLRGA